MHYFRIFFNRISQTMSYSFARFAKNAYYCDFYRKIVFLFYFYFSKFGTKVEPSKITQFFYDNKFLAFGRIYPLPHDYALARQWADVTCYLFTYHARCASLPCYQLNTCENQTFPLKAITLIIYFNLLIKS